MYEPTYEYYGLIQLIQYDKLRVIKHIRKRVKRLIYSYTTFSNRMVNGGERENADVQSGREQVNSVALVR
jgi:hypothetical protein